MTTGEYSPLLRSGSSRTSTTQHHLPISAHYFDITDIESWPIAGLLVLLDGQAQPVRAELHFYDDLEPHVQEAAIRQARLVLQERYLGGSPVPVRILDTLPVREEMLVRLPPVGARPMSMPSMPLTWRPYGVIGAIILLVVALIWVIVGQINGGRAQEVTFVATSIPAAIDQPAGEVEAESPAADSSAGVVETEGEAAAPANDSELPSSNNARQDLGIGVQVQVVPGLRVALRSEPGADRGIVVGEMTEGIVATIIGGPMYTQGDSDTIVWWYVDLPNGTQAWAAANTSLQTLLMPVE